MGEKFTVLLHNVTLSSSVMKALDRYTVMKSVDYSGYEVSAEPSEALLALAFCKEPHCIVVVGLEEMYLAYRVSSGIVFADATTPLVSVEFISALLEADPNADFAQVFDLGCFTSPFVHSRRFVGRRAAVSQETSLLGSRTRAQFILMALGASLTEGGQEGSVLPSQPVVRAIPLKDDSAKPLSLLIASSGADGAVTRLRDLAAQAISSVEAESLLAPEDSDNYLFASTGVVTLRHSMVEDLAARATEFVGVPATALVGEEYVLRPFSAPLCDLVFTPVSSLQSLSVAKDAAEALGARVVRCSSADGVLVEDLPRPENGIITLSSSVVSSSKALNRLLAATDSNTRFRFLVDVNFLLTAAYIAPAAATVAHRCSMPFKATRTDSTLCAKSPPLFTIYIAKRMSALKYGATLRQAQGGKADFVCTLDFRPMPQGLSVPPRVPVVAARYFARAFPSKVASFTRLGVRLQARPHEADGPFERVPPYSLRLVMERAGIRLEAEAGEARMPSQTLTVVADPAFFPHVLLLSRIIAVVTHRVAPRMVFGEYRPTHEPAIVFSDESVDGAVTVSPDYLRDLATHTVSGARPRGRYRRALPVVTDYLVPPQAADSSSVPDDEEIRL